MITFSLNTFIKISLLDTGGRISEIQKRLSRTAGYDFYKPLQKSVRAYSDQEYDRAAGILQAPANEVERQKNEEAFECFKAKYGASRSLESVLKPKKLNFATAGISIAVDPLFEVTKSGVRQVYSLWPTQAPPLTQKYGAVACHIMRLAYEKDSLANGSFFFADLVGSKVYSENK